MDRLPRIHLHQRHVEGLTLTLDSSKARRGGPEARRKVSGFLSIVQPRPAELTTDLAARGKGTASVRIRAGSCECRQYVYCTCICLTKTDTWVYVSTTSVCVGQVNSPGSTMLTTPPGREKLCHRPKARARETSQVWAKLLE